MNGKELPCEQQRKPQQLVLPPKQGKQRRHERLQPLDRRQLWHGRRQQLQRPQRREQHPTRPLPRPPQCPCTRAVTKQRRYRMARDPPRNSQHSGSRGGVVAAALVSPGQVQAAMRRAVTAPRQGHPQAPEPRGRPVSARTTGGAGNTRAGAARLASLTATGIAAAPGMVAETAAASHRRTGAAAGTGPDAAINGGTAGEAQEARAHLMWQRSWPWR